MVCECGTLHPTLLQTEVAQHCYCVALSERWKCGRYALAVYATWKTVVQRARGVHSASATLAASVGDKHDRME